MRNLDHKWNPGTETSRRPTPEKFEHLRKWIAVIEHNIGLTTITEITNINQQLEQSAKLFINNVISRTISQMVVAYGDGFVTLQGTEDGHLIVQNEREAKNVTSAVINFATSGNHTIVTGVAGSVIKITKLMFTVGGETNITFYGGAVALTGPMDFGGTDEPRGIVDTQGFLPYEVAEGESFIMNSSGAVQVSGYLTGYLD